MSLRPQRGIALLLVVIVVAAVVVMVGDAQFRNALELRLTTNLVFADQALAYHLGAEDWAAALLAREGRDNATDDLTEDWNQRGLVLPVEGGRIVGALHDLQGRFNLNNLLKADGSTDADALAQYRRLLATLDIDGAERIASATLDWVDGDQEPHAPFGAEDATYLRLDPPYRSADRRMLWVGELRAVDGVTPEMYARLAPHLAALPGRTAINVNTATLAVLQSLSDAAVGDPLEGVLARQRQAPFAELADFRASFGHPLASGITLGVRSDNFALQTAVAIEGLTTTMYSLLARAPGGATRTVRRSADPEP